MKKTPLLKYNESHTNSFYFEHNFDKYSLKARILYNESGDVPWVFSVHGARSDYTKSDAVTAGLRDRGYSILGFNMSGHNGTSKIPVEETTLGNNIRESSAFFSYLDPKRKKKIIAYSLGATPALKTLGNYIDQVDKIVLFGPGIYTAQAYNKQFGKEFRKIISTPFSYIKNDVVSILKDYKGELLLVKGQYDGLDPVIYDKPIGTSVGEVEINGKLRYSPIPKEVIEMIYKAVPARRRKLITLPGCDHGVVPWIVAHENEGASVLNDIALFLHS